MTMCENCSDNKGIADARYCATCETIIYLYVIGSLTQGQMVDDLLMQKTSVYEARSCKE